MSQARYAGFRHMRGAGYSLALPIAVATGSIVGVVSGSRSTGVVAGSAMSLFGLFILWVGYSFGDILSSYWMIPLVLAALPLALLAGVFGHGQAWLWALGGDAMVVLMIGIVLGIDRNANDYGGLSSAMAHIVRSFIPGYYSR